MSNKLKKIYNISSIEERKFFSERAISSKRIFTDNDLYDKSHVGKIMFRYKGVVYRTPFDSINTSGGFRKFEKWKTDKGFDLNNL